LRELENLVSKLDIDRSVKATEYYTGGLGYGKKLLDKFIENKLDGYLKYSNDPTKNYLSDMSPYLHFGQISPVYIALKIRGSNSPASKDFLEQLIVRRELAMNFTNYNSNYKNIECLPEWAIKTLKKHESDNREYIYTLEEFERGKTHDPYWNAAQMEMVETGKMHGYMRMYWGKKILEWSPTPEEAYKRALFLNNKYELDGRDPNSYAGVAWCFGKHDQGWKERPIYGKVRYMSDSGLERKFKIAEYVNEIENIPEREIN